VSVGKRDETQVAGAAVHEGGHGGLAADAYDQVSFPVAETLAVFNCGWTLVDQGGGRHEAGHALMSATALPAQWAAGAEFPGQCPAQAVLAALVERSVDLS
jgi:hypothetical protein